MRLRPHGISASDPDRAYRSPGRWCLVAGAGIPGAVMCWDAVREVVDGTATRDTYAFLDVGVLLLGLAALFTAPRRADPAPAVQGEGCVLLPVRRTPLVAGWVIALLWWPLYLLIDPSEVPTPRHESMWPLIEVGAPVLCAWLAWRLVRADLRLRLDPTGVGVPSFLHDRVEHVPWDLVDEMLSRRRFRPELLLVHQPQGDEPAFTAIDLRIPQWRAGLLATVLEHYIEHPGARADLADAAAVDRFLQAAPAPASRSR